MSVGNKKECRNARVYSTIKQKKMIINGTIFIKVLCDYRDGTTSIWFNLLYS